MIVINTTTKEISTIKGDSGAVTIGIDNYNMVTGDRLYFGIKKTLSDTTYLKPLKTITSFTNGKAEIILSITDTDLDPATYIYGLKLVRSDGNKDTLIKEGYANFTIKRGVINE